MPQEKLNVVLFVIAFFVVSSINGFVIYAQDGHSRDSMEVAESENELVAAYIANDVDVIESLYDNDLIFHSPDGRVLTKKDDLQNLASGALKVLQYTPLKQSLTTNDNVAIVSVLLHIKVEVSGSPFEGDFHFMRVWKKKGKVEIDRYQR